MKRFFKSLRISAKPIGGGALSDLGEYRVNRIYLGLEGCLRTRDTELRLSYSVRDGILVGIRSISPRRVLFEYSDGGCMVNGDAAPYSELLSELNRLREAEEGLDSSEIYARLEAVVRRHVTSEPP